MGAVPASLSAANQISVQLNGLPPPTTAEELLILRMPSELDFVFWKVLLAISIAAGGGFPSRSPPFLLQLEVGTDPLAGAGKTLLLPVGLDAEAAELPCSACPGQISGVNGEAGDEGHGCRQCKFKCSRRVRTKLARLQLLLLLSHCSFPPFPSLPGPLSSRRGCHCVGVLRDESERSLMGDMIVL